MQEEGNSSEEKKEVLKRFGSLKRELLVMMNVQLYGGGGGAGRVN